MRCVGYIQHSTRELNSMEWYLGHLKEGEQKVGLMVAADSNGIDVFVGENSLAHHVKRYTTSQMQYVRQSQSWWQGCLGLTCDKTLFQTIGIGLFSRRAYLKAKRRRHHYVSRIVLAISIGIVMLLKGCSSAKPVSLSGYNTKLAFWYMKYKIVY